MPVASANLADVQAPRSAIAVYRPSLRPTLTSTPEKAAPRSVTTWPIKASTSPGAGWGVNRVMMGSFAFVWAGPKAPAPFAALGSRQSKGGLDILRQSLARSRHDDGKGRRNQARRANHQPG